jgi:hypothetical protein
MQESERPKVANQKPCDVSNGMVEEAKTRNEGIKILTKLRRDEDGCNTLKSFKDGENVNESIFKSLTPVHTPRQANSKVQPLAVASPRAKRRNQQSLGYLSRDNLLMENKRLKYVGFTRISFGYVLHRTGVFWD